MKRSTKILLTIIYFIIIILLFNCTLFTDKELGSFLEGTWEGNFSGGLSGTAKMNFKDDGSGKLELKDTGTGVSNDFVCTDGNNKTITLDFDDWSASDGKYDYKLSGDHLTINNFKYRVSFLNYEFKLDMIRK